MQRLINIANILTLLTTFLITARKIPEIKASQRAQVGPCGERCRAELNITTPQKHRANRKRCSW